MPLKAFRPSATQAMSDKKQNFGIENSTGVPICAAQVPLGGGNGVLPRQNLQNAPNIRENHAQNS